MDAVETIVRESYMTQPFATLRYRPKRAGDIHARYTDWTRSTFQLFTKVVCCFIPGRWPVGLLTGS